MCIYIYIYIYTNLPVNTIVRLPHPRSGDSQGQETFLVPSVQYIHIYTYIYIYILYILYIIYIYIYVYIYIYINEVSLPQTSQ